MNIFEFYEIFIFQIITKNTQQFVREWNSGALTYEGETNATRPNNKELFLNFLIIY